jgi:flagellar basal body-associated protein FliL
MDGLIFIVIGIIAILVILGILLTMLFLIRKEDRKCEEPDYQAFFIIGFSFLPLGIIFTIIVGPAFIGFTGIGICYMAIGLANKDKWERRN